MQDRYTGDIGDFGKLGLLRELHRNGLSIGINWYLVPNETHNGDGRLIGYLKNRSFAACDEELWRSLGEIVKNDQREVAALEKDAILPARRYSARLVFSDSRKSDRRAIRDQWHADAVGALHGCDLVFVDPDNGLICPSAVDTKKSNKYVLCKELADYYNTGASVVYYQHKARRKDEFYIDQHKALLSSGGFPAATGIGLKFKTASLRYYFFIVQPRHKEMICQGIQNMLETEWGKHFQFLLCDE